MCSRSSAVRNTMHACVFTLRHYLSLCATCQPASRTAAGGSRVLFSLFCVCVLCQSAKAVILFFSLFFLSFFSKGKLFNSCVEQDQRNSKWKNSHSFFFFFFPLLKRLGAFEKPDSAVTICEMSVCVGVRECARACICGLSLSYPCSPERGAAASLHGRKREVGREGGRERND